MQFFYIIPFIPLLVITSCYNNDYKNQDVKDKVLVKFNNKTLKLSDLSDVLINAKNKNDSDQIIIDYCNEWAKKQIYLDLFEKYLSYKKSEVEKQVQEYRDNLLIYMYQNAYLASKLDTNVTREEIEEYIRNHKMDLKLEESLIKAFLIQIPKSYLSNKLKKNLNITDLSEKMISEICSKYAFKCINHTKQWVSYNFFLSYISNTYTDYANILIESNKIIEISDSNFVYFIKVEDFRKAGEPMPDDYIAEHIVKPYILAERKKKLLKNLEKTMIENYLKNNKIEFFYKR
ncbi:MAG: hypothetical protein N3A01_00570 [Bacteroidales bacterium]|nr:hypothetical protein [Bacteroidales bacterium]